MPLAITANASSWGIDGVDLSVTGATGGLVTSTPYTANFASGYDSWTAGADSGASPTASYFTGGRIVPGYVSGSSRDWSTEAQYMQRVVTGLTIGVVYKATVTLRTWSGPSSLSAYVGVVGIGNGSSVSVVGLADADATYTFTATATSHTIRVRIVPAFATAMGIMGAKVQALSSAPNGPLTIQRIDANGSHYVRLEESNQSPSPAGAFSCTDWEAAMGPVQYLVRDSGGSTALSATVNTLTANPTAKRVRLVAAGRALMEEIDYIETWDEGIDYVEAASSLSIIGRPEPIISTRADNRWSARKGRMRLYAEDYDQAQRIMDVYRASRVVFLVTDRTTLDRDMMHTASSITAEPVTQTVNGWTWAVDVEYQEVAWPSGWLIYSGGSPITYDTVVDNYLAYFNVLLSRSTYTDLKLNG